MRERDSPDLSVVTAYDSLDQRQHLNFQRSDYTQGDQSSRAQYGARSKFVQTPPPTFGGNRREWAEFRTVWRRFGASEYASDEERAYALKTCLKGPAFDCVRAIFVTQPRAYERIWQRLDSIYSDVSLCVQSTFEQLTKLKRVGEEDMRGLTEFVNEVELCYSQLGEVNQIQAITMTHVDNMNDLLPLTVQKEWMRTFDGLSVQDQIHPFSPFMRFLEGQRRVAIRLSERQRETGKHKHKGSAYQSNTLVKHGETGGIPSSSCLIHPKVGTGTAHTLVQCYKFKAMSQSDKVALLKQHKACFRCFGRHMRSDCSSNACCEHCGKDNHHSLLCRARNSSEPQSEECVINVETATATVSPSYCVDHGQLSGIHPIQAVAVQDTDKTATVFFDSGSNCTFVTHRAAQRLGAKQLSKADLELSTMGQRRSPLTTYLYEVNLLTPGGEKQVIRAYGIEDIMGPVSPLDIGMIRNLFPWFVEVEKLQRESVEVDILVGNNYHGLHPIELFGRAGEHLSLLRGPLGVCIQGSHPQLRPSRSPSLLASADCRLVDSVPVCVLSQQCDEMDQLEPLCEEDKLFRRPVADDVRHSGEEDQTISKVLDSSVPSTSVCDSELAEQIDEPEGYSTISLFDCFSYSYEYLKDSVKVLGEVDPLVDYNLSEGVFKSMSWSFSRSAAEELVKVLVLVTDPGAHEVCLSLLQHVLRYFATESGIRYNQSVTNLVIILPGNHQPARGTALSPVTKVCDLLGPVFQITLPPRNTWQPTVLWFGPVANGLSAQCFSLFSVLFQLHKLGYVRCLTAEQVNSGSDFTFILPFDSGDITCVFDTRAQWEVNHGRFWCGLSPSEDQISLVEHLKTPQLEWEGSVFPKMREERSQTIFDTVWVVVGLVFCILPLMALVVNVGVSWHQGFHLSDLGLPQMVKPANSTWDQGAVISVNQAVLNCTSNSWGVSEAVGERLQLMEVAEIDWFWKWPP